MIVEKIVFSKKVKNFGLFICYDKNKHPVLYIGDERNNLFLKKFCGQFDLQKFLVEAVILRMSASKQNIKEVQTSYVNLCNFLNERSKSEEV